MKKLLLAFILIALSGIVLGCNSQKESIATDKTVQVTVSAASSMTDVINELKELYIKDNPRITINCNYASSGTLFKQIEEGAPVDLFISADQEKIDLLAQKQLIQTDTYCNLTSNEIVLLVGKDSKIEDFSDLLKPSVSKIAIGDPQIVPAGQYGKEVLENLQLWQQLQPKLLMAMNVRQVLAYVESGEVEAGLVYKTDAMLAKSSKIAAVAPTDSHQTIIYPAAVVSNSKNSQEAERFLDFLSSAEAKPIYEKYGFRND